MGVKERKPQGGDSEAVTGEEPPWFISGACVAPVQGPTAEHVGAPPPHHMQVLVIFGADLRTAFLRNLNIQSSRPTGPSAGEHSASRSQNLTESHRTSLT